ncbi:MFS transporter [[Bacillus] sp. KCTC 13219]|uniref:MFS transporter n=1 Tax=Metasolibacillus fluoroglycofenilyticus TaxID=1239396 RepID=UPI000793AB92|nr:MFS transporter [Metasolibacillus fluoroglycofenilyticus]KYG89741.1 MFS transporter [[Bacillus] sp. KCTC 13219]
MENWKRNITLFLTSQTISLFGSALVQYAIMWHVTLTTQSGMMMTIFIICGFVPTFLLSPFAGVWADRYNRKWLIAIADGVIALSTLVLAIVFLMGYEEMWLLFVIAAIRSFGAGVQTPAVGAILPQIVPEEKLTKVNGINGSIQAGIMFIAPMVSAALLSFATLEIIFFIDVVTAALAIFTLLFFLKIAAHEKAMGEQVGYIEDFKQGLRYIREHTFLKSFFLFFALLFFLIAPMAFLTPLQVARSFGDDVWRLTVIELTFSIGMMVGGSVIAIWGGFKNRVHTMIFAGVIMAVCTISLGLVPNFLLYSVLMLICGVAMPIFNTPSTVLLQEKVEGNYLGRIFGIFGMISSSMMPIGMLVFGPLADVIEIEWILIVTGILMIALLLLLAKNRTLITAGVNEVKEQSGINR